MSHYPAIALLAAKVGLSFQAQLLKAPSSTAAQAAAEPSRYPTAVRRVVHGAKRSDW